MTEVHNSQNLNAHYSTSSKVERPKIVAVTAPDKLPTANLFNDVSANKRMETICNDIYVDTKKEEGKEGRNFIKYFGGGVAAVLGFLGLRTLFK